MEAFTFAHDCEENISSPTNEKKKCLHQERICRATEWVFEPPASHARPNLSCYWVLKSCETRAIKGDSSNDFYTGPVRLDYLMTNTENATRQE
ncbi:hypothetical protein NPIL_375761 [Nephila pilipes]|uniref:Uncharacterized protein n=1 Tax=Nephila pilipes TaxID=299642 RepID=A0A8X6MVK7_NEPPI|nr:hypothetical protein NPIL_375761 [Nephila pilipes]